jgi:DHA1 family bicyclomycin/chloramphenicol resistance-like MFS transporter
MLFAYISSSPFIVQGILGFTPFAYTVVFGLNGVGLMIAGAIAGAVAKRVSPRRVIGWGVTLQLVAAGVLVTTWITQSPSAWNILPALFLLVSAMGFMFGPATALALTQVRQYGGTALAVQGSIQFLIASVMATAVGLAGPHEFWPLALIVLLASLVSLTFWIRSKKSLVEVL